MKERPILFSSPMIRALLDGSKTVTRRIVNLKTLRVRLASEVKSDFPSAFDARRAAPGIHKATLNDHGAVSVDANVFPLGVRPGEFDFVCPYADGKTHLGNYGVRGKQWTLTPTESRLWVRETFCWDPCSVTRPIYAADFDTDRPLKGSWRPSIFMPRSASRILLDVVGVRLERLHCIDDADAKAEGIKPYLIWTPRDAYAKLWDKLNAKRATFASNPWVWRIEFRRVKDGGAK